MKRNNRYDRIPRECEVRLRACGGILLLLALLQSGRTMAADKSLPVAQRVSILLKALTFDKRLPVRCPKNVKVGVVALSGHGASIAEAREVLQTHIPNSAVRLKGLPVIAAAIVVSSTDQVAQATTRSGFKILYLTTGMGKMIPKLAVWADQVDVLLICGSADHMTRGGALGVIERDQSPVILLNLPMAIKQGADFDERLLQVAVNVE